jgi:hypothetical protein
MADALDRIPKEAIEDEGEVEEVKEIDEVKDPEGELLDAEAYEADDDDEEHGERGAASGKNS